MPLSITQALDDLYTTTWQNRREGVADNVFGSAAFWYYLKDKNKMRSVRGGRFIEVNLEYDKNATVAWIGRGGTVSLNDYKFLTVGQFQWRYLVANITRFGVDDQQNSGKSQILNWVRQKIDNTQNSLVDSLETALAAGSGAAAGQVDGLQFLVADDPTQAANNVGGIDPSTYTWWRNQAVDMTGQSFATNGVDKMRTLLHNCMNNRKMDAPDIILTAQSPYEFYEDTVLTYYRTSDRKLADAGFENQAYKGIPMVWTPAISQRMYFLNTRFLEFIYDPAMFFEMTEWKPIPDQPNDRAAQIVTACQLTTNRRRVLGVLKGINTA